MTLIDTHCHLHDANAFPDPRAEIDAALDAGVRRIVLVGTHPPDWDLAVALAEAHEELFAIVGWHPNYTAEYSPESLMALREHLQHPKVLALGEIGLDYHWDHSPREQQFRALKDQLDLAEDLGLSVVFHAREAYGDLLTLLETRPRRPYLFHCWAGSEEEAGRAVALDAYFGVDGPVTYPKADALRQVLRKVPANRIVTETDAPYMSPVPYRGKPNRPAYVRFVNSGLAKALDQEETQCANLTTTNAIQFFGPKLKV